jgi:hypothetical protein
MIEADLRHAFLDFGGLREIADGHLRDDDLETYWEETSAMWNRYRGLLEEQGGFRDLVAMRDNLEGRDPAKMSEANLSKTIIESRTALARHRAALIDQIVSYYSLFLDTPPTLEEMSEKVQIATSGDGS